MDEMQDYEVSTLVESLEYADRNFWEMTRLLMYQNIQINSKKTINIKDIIKFKWDESIVDQEQTQEISSDDVERLKQLSKALSNQIQKNTTAT